MGALQVNSMLSTDPQRDSGRFGSVLPTPITHSVGQDDAIQQTPSNIGQRDLPECLPPRCAWDYTGTLMFEQQ